MVLDHLALSRAIAGFSVSKNQGQTLKGGKWLAIDERLMFKAKVSAYETLQRRVGTTPQRQFGVAFRGAAERRCAQAAGARDRWD
jgi:hypothetical protein